MIKGISASTGYAIGKVYKYCPETVEVLKANIEDTVAEIALFKGVIEECEKDLLALQSKTEEKLGAEEAEIFSAHIQLLKDPEVLSGVEEKINEDKVNALYAFNEVMEPYIKLFKNMEDTYFKERSADLEDIRKRVLLKLSGKEHKSIAAINEAVILLAEDMTPSDTAQIDKAYVQGFITAIGGRTSHSAIMARSLELPAIVGAGEAMTMIEDGQFIIMDAVKGEVHLSPAPQLIDHYEALRCAYEEEQKRLLAYKDKTTLTKEGRPIEVAANIGSPADLEGVLANGAEGIGLFRTEFLYMESNDFPSEDAQYQVYKSVLSRMDGKPVVIRTLDIGGDKQLDYLKLPEELNPFLGHRAIRLCLKEQDLFKNQLRALLRASVHGQLRIMFPMIATIEEFRAAKALYEDVKAELIEAGHPVADTIEVGIMVEIPSVALLADVFAKEVDFFSIGTNDLIQYTFAADRMNPEVAYLYQPYHPSLLRMIKMVIDSAHLEGKWVGMCGEMAGDPIAIPLLVGLGIDELSMSASSVLKSRYLISTYDSDESHQLSCQAMALDSHKHVQELVEAFLG